MKTAEEIMLETTENAVGAGYIVPCLVQAMKAYAKQCAEQALKDAAERMYSVGSQGMTIKETILSTPILTP